MSTIKGSYQSIREELVALSIELEERGKVSDLLRRKLDEERHRARDLEDVMKHEYDARLQELMLKHRDDMQLLMKQSSELVNQKKDLMESCQTLVEQVSAKEQELAQEIRRIRDEGQDALERDKKIFKAGYEERKNKALSEKMQAIKQETRRAMEPEFQRLRRQQDQELNELLDRVANEEKALRDEYDKMARDRMAEEERVWKMTSQARAREALESASIELNLLEENHKVELNKMLARNKHDIQQRKSTMDVQLDSEKKRLKASLVQLQADNEKQLSEVVRNHKASVERLYNEHDELLRQIRLRDQSARAASDRQHEADIAAATSIKHKAKHASVDAEMSTRDRDAKVQAEIRRLQTETIKQERDLKSKCDKEKVSIISAAENELELFNRSCHKAELDIVELSSQKEQLIAAIQRSTNERISMQEEKSLMETEIDKLEYQIREREEQKAKHAEIAATQKKWALDAVTEAAEKSHKKFLTVLKMLNDKEAVHKQEICDIEKKFERTLEELDVDVKRDVARCEHEIEVLRDAVHSEKIKNEKLKKILKNYSK